MSSVVIKMSTVKEILKLNRGIFKKKDAEILFLRNKVIEERMRNFDLENNHRAELNLMEENYGEQLTEAEKELENNHRAELILMEEQLAEAEKELKKLRKKEERIQKKKAERILRRKKKKALRKKVQSQSLSV